MYVVFAPSAHALSCVQPPENMLDRGEVIFLGKVTALHVPSAPVEDRPFDSTRRGEDRVTFSVSKYWKGDMGTTIDVHGVYAWGWSGPFFQNGESYIVFARKVQNGSSTQIFANIDCNSTGLASPETEKALDALVSSKRPPAIPPLSPVVQYSRNLTLGSTGSDVAMLQSFLETKGLLTMPLGVSKGYFGGLTKAALAKYQAQENIAPAYGYFGPLTRARVSVGIGQ